MFFLRIYAGRYSVLNDKNTILKYKKIRKFRVLNIEKVQFVERIWGKVIGMIRVNTGWGHLWKFQ